MPRPALFLDRDGTINEDLHYLSDPGQVVLIPGSAEAIASVNQLGIPVIVVTNQAGIAKGLIPFEVIDLIHGELNSQLARFNAKVDGYYFCPHHPQGPIAVYTLDCNCRKPRAGMLQRAALEHDLDLSSSWMVGDRLTDAEAGAAAGCKTVLVRTGYGSQLPEELDETSLNLAGRVADLAEAVQLWKSSVSR
jgi:D-glycero-D-manno-heptose 1,7-bisphosphate phosphatase